MNDEVRSKTMQLVLIDDDDFLRKAMARLYSNWFTVTAFSDPVDALAHLQALREECLIVCDYDMPKLNGRQVYDQLSQRQQQRFVLFTGNHEVEKPPLGKLLHKPADHETIMEVIEEWTT